MKKQRCERCNLRIIKHPIWHGQEYDQPFSWDKIIWRNLIKIDLQAVLFAAIIMYLIWSYNFEIDHYQDITEHPKKYCMAYCATLTDGNLLPPMQNEDIQDAYKIDYQAHPD